MTMNALHTLGGGERKENHAIIVIISAFLQSAKYCWSWATYQGQDHAKIVCYTNEMQ